MKKNEELTLVTFGDKNFEFNFKEGKKNFTVHSSGTSDNTRIGDEYQAEIPDLVNVRNVEDPVSERYETCVKLWSPTNKLTDYESKIFN